MKRKRSKSRIVLHKDSKSPYLMLTMLIVVAVGVVYVFFAQPADTGRAVGCSSICSYGGQRICDGVVSTAYRVCGDFNYDGCLEWSSIKYCASGQKCTGYGTCATSSGCTNDCSSVGQKICYGSSAYKQCGNYDSDSCYEWSNYQYCTGSQKCEGGKCVSLTCSNECSYANAKQCSGTSGYQTCGNYDSDSCLEWGGMTYCYSGKVCSSGSCVTAPSCSNECSSGQNKCYGTNAYQTCGNYDSDSCYEWSSSITCPSGKTCSSGACVGGSCSNDCVSGQKVCYSSLAYKQCGQYDSDSCLDWSALTNCPSGYTCSNGNCVAGACSNECSTSGTKVCSGSYGYKQCGQYDSDTCLDWSGYVGCPSGYYCSAGTCKSSYYKPYPL
ncbi:MAG: hypothetical protein V1645_03870 [archaeon]